jgi:hypothetical protein
MENNNANSYIKADDNRILNEKHIRWVKKIDDCLIACTKSNGCSTDVRNTYDTHKICKLNNFSSYNKLNQIFMESSNE